MTTLYTTQDAAATLGRSLRTVQRDCTRLGLGTRLGNGPRVPLVLTAAEVETLRDAPRNPPGNPQMQRRGGAKKLQRKGLPALRKAAAKRRRTKKTSTK